MEGIQYGIQQGYNPMTTGAYGSQPYGSQFGQQGLFGGAGNPYSGLMGSGIPGLMGGQNIDPITAAQIQLQQQAQLAHLAQHAQLAQQLAQQRAQFGQQSPVGPWLGMNPLNRIDPITAAYIQQAIAQLVQQLALQSQLGQQGQFGNQFGHHLGHQFGQGQFGQGQFGQGQFGQGQGWGSSGQNLGGQNFGGYNAGGQNPWVNPQFATQFGRNFQYGGPLPVY